MLLIVDTGLICFSGPGFRFRTFLNTVPRPLNQHMETKYHERYFSSEKVIVFSINNRDKSIADINYLSRPVFRPKSLGYSSPLCSKLYFHKKER
jgi:hypothetical protein